MISRAAKRGPGRPELGKNARTIVVPIKFSARELGAVKSAAKKHGTTISSWIREHAVAPLVACTRIVLRDDDDDYHWIALADDGFPIATGWLRGGPQADERVRRAASDRGVRGADAATVEVEP